MSHKHQARAASDDSDDESIPRESDLFDMEASEGSDNSGDSDDSDDSDESGESGESGESRRFDNDNAGANGNHKSSSENSNGSGDCREFEFEEEHSGLSEEQNSLSASDEEVEEVIGPEQRARRAHAKRRQESSHSSYGERSEQYLDMYNDSFGYADSSNGDHGESVRIHTERSMAVHGNPVHATGPGMNMNTHPPYHNGFDGMSDAGSSMPDHTSMREVPMNCHVMHMYQKEKEMDSSTIDYRVCMANHREFAGGGGTDCLQEVRAPIFPQGMQDDAGWLDFASCAAGGDTNNFPINPKRAMCINIPAECFSSDATRLTHWQTPLKNPTRATNIATLLGLLWTPTSKGWMSGMHEEVARDTGDDVDAGGGGNGGSGGGTKKKPLTLVDRYLFVDPLNHERSLPMFAMAYEEIYDRTQTKVLAIRIWKLVFDGMHSDSELVRKLIDENLAQWAQSGVAHAPNIVRSQKLTMEHKRSIQLVGGSSMANTRLEYHAGTQYLRVNNEHTYIKLLRSYSGQSDTCEGRPVYKDLGKNLPPGTLNRRLERCDKLGGNSPIAPEYLFNAMRTCALQAGLVDMEGRLMDVDPDQMCIESYFKFDQATGTRSFDIPQFVKEKKAFYFMTDPAERNPFDLPMPRSIVGTLSPGNALLELFRDQFTPGTDLSSPLLVDYFNNVMTGTDQWTQKQLTQMAESITTFDTAECTDDERVQAKMAKNILRNAGGAGGLRSYGTDGGATCVEPRQVLKEISFESAQVHSKIIAPWVQSQYIELERQECGLREANGGRMRDVEIDDPFFVELTRKKQLISTKHTSAMRDLAYLHLARMERAFCSRVDADAIPAGYRAAWEGLQTELEDMPNKTANIAFGLNMQLTDSDRTVFGHMTNWIGTFFEDDCFVDGRDWRIIQELFLHFFEQYHEQTLLLILCGPKGNGKTLRTERAMAAFVPGWVKESGPSSAKAGAQGNSDSNNGCNCIYDEMIDELTDSDGSNRTEYWKMILMKREYVYNKVIAVKDANGSESQKTFQLVTPHRETHAVCTNRGPAFTKGQEDPSEVKTALIDRSVQIFVRTLGTKTRTEAEFRANMGKPEVKRKRQAFRILTCLMALVEMFIYRQPYFSPDMAIAQKMWDQWDDGYKGLTQGYGLPRPSPRKNIKRMQNCITLTALNAVAEVFFFKQTSFMYESSRRDSINRLRPFDIRQLWEAIQLMQPTPEIIHHTWSMSLEYNIGTSMMGVNAMTAIADAFKIGVGDLFRKSPLGDISGFALQEDEIVKMSGNYAKQAGAGEGGDKEPPQQPPPLQQAVQSKISSHFRRGGIPINEFEPIFVDAKSKLMRPDGSAILKHVQIHRRTRATFKSKCSQSALRNLRSQDAERLAIEAIEPGICLDIFDPVTGKLQGAEETDKRFLGTKTALPPEEFGRKLFNEHEEAPSSKAPPLFGVAKGFHDARSIDFPGLANCAFQHELPPPLAHVAFGNNEADEPVPLLNAMQQFRESVRDESSKRQCPYCEKDAPTHLSPEASALWPTTLYASLFYKPQTLVQWSNGLCALIDPPGEPTVGTRPCFSYAQKLGIGGTRGKNLAWLELTNNTRKAAALGTAGTGFDSWFKFAQYVRDHAKCPTPTQFDYHLDGLKDVFYLLSTGDNARPIQEEIYDPTGDMAEIMGDNLGRPLTEHVRAVKPMDFPDPDNPGRAVPAGTETLPRHPSAFAPDTMLQRRCDAMLRAGRLPALNPLISNNVTSAAPIRMMQDGVKVSLSALYDHMLLVFEASLVCSEMAGMRNMQERFSNNQSGPRGLTGRTHNAPGASKRTVQQRDDIFDEDSHTMPYCYDLVQIAISVDMASMLYDDMSVDHLRQANANHKNLKMKLDEDGMPQLTLRYPGLREDNRQTLSIRVAHQRPADQPYIEAGDPSAEDSIITLAHVSRSLGRCATEEDRVEYIARREGARSMSGVTGDVFAHSTWFKHTIASLSRRGIISGEAKERAFVSFANMNSCTMARVLEHASKSNTDGYGKLELEHARPNTYLAQEKARKAIEQEAAKQMRPPKRKMQISKPRVDVSMFGGLDTVGDLLRMSEEAEEAEEEREAAARLGHAPSSAGAGVSGTSGTMETPGFELGSRVDTREARLRR